MGGNDRATDGQPHAHAAGLGAEEGLEHLLLQGLGYARPAVLDQHQQLFVLAKALQAQAAIAGRQATDRLDGVLQQIAHHLLQLHGIPRHQQAALQLQAQLDVLVVDFRLDDGQHLADHLCRIEWQALARCLAGERTGRADDFGCTTAFRKNVLQAFQRIAHRGLLALQPAHAGRSVGEDGGQRLIDLVGDGRRQLAKNRRLRGTLQFAARGMQFGLGTAPLADIADHADQGVEVGRLQQQLQVARRWLCRDAAKLQTHAAPLIQRGRQRLLETCAIILMHQRRWMLQIILARRRVQPQLCQQRRRPERRLGTQAPDEGTVATHRLPQRQQRLGTPQRVLAFPATLVFGQQIAVQTRMAEGNRRLRRQQGQQIDPRGIDHAGGQAILQIQRTNHFALLDQRQTEHRPRIQLAQIGIVGVTAQGIAPLHQQRPATGHRLAHQHQRQQLFDRLLRV